MKQDLFDMLLSRKKEIQAELQQVNAAIAAVQGNSVATAIPRTRKQSGIPKLMGMTKVIQNIASERLVFDHTYMCEELRNVKGFETASMTSVCAILNTLARQNYLKKDKNTGVYSIS